MNSNEYIRNTEQDMYDYSNPNRIGRGVWFMFMLTSVHAETRIQRLSVCKDIRLFSKYFKCKECHGHCVQYLKEHPPENTIDSRYGLFDWVVDFMNAVQIRKKRPTYDRDRLFSIFTNEEDGVCSSDCTKSHGNNDHDTGSEEIALRTNDDITIHNLNKSIPGIITSAKSTSNINPQSNRPSFGFHLVKNNF